MPNLLTIKVDCHVMVPVDIVIFAVYAFFELELLVVTFPVRSARIIWSMLYAQLKLIKISAAFKYGVIILAMDIAWTKNQ